MGRVLVSADVRHRRTTDERTGETLVVLDVAFTGDEIGDTQVTVARRVWVEDPADLNSPMHYRTEILDNPPPGEAATGMSPAARRVLEVLRREAGAINVKRIGDRLADQNDYALKARTIQEALGHLEAAGHVKRGDQDPFGALLWAVSDR